MLLASNCGGKGGSTRPNDPPRLTPKASEWKMVQNQIVKRARGTQPDRSRAYSKGGYQRAQAALYSPGACMMGPRMGTKEARPTLHVAGGCESLTPAHARPISILGAVLLDEGDTRVREAT
eukprot:11700965-Alexandrium_andersonii.AAC.1